MYVQYSKRFFGRFVLCGTLLGSFGLVACKKKDQSGDNAKAAEVEKKADAITPHPLEIPAITAHQSQYGHLRIGNLQAAVESGKKLLPPDKAAQVNIQDLRSNLGGMLGNPAIGDKLELNKPLGCVMYNPMGAVGQGQLPGACVFHYAGGADALAKDLASNPGKKDPKGHKAIVSVMGQELVFDGLDSAVMVSGSADVAAQSKDYLKANILDAKYADPNALTTDIFIGDIYKSYKGIAQPFIDKAIDGADAPADEFGDALVTQQKAALKQLVAAIEEIGQMRLEFSATDTSTRFTFSGSASTPAPTFKSLVEQGGALTVDIKYLGFLPEKSILVGVQGKNLEAQSKNSFTRSSIEAMGDFVKMKLKTEADVSKHLLAFMDENAKLLSGQGAGAMWHDTSGPIGMGWVAGVQSGKNVREFWKSQLSKLNAEALGPELAGKVVVKYEENAAKVGDVELDRFTVEATEATKESMKKEMGEEDYAQLIKIIGAPKLVFELAQVGDTAVVVTAFADATAYSKTAVEALQGKGALAMHASYKGIAERIAGNQGGFALDFKAATDWLRSIAPEKDRAEIPSVGKDLSDFVWVARSDANAGIVFEAELSASVITKLVQHAEM